MEMNIKEIVEYIEVHRPFLHDTFLVFEGLRELDNLVELDDIKRDLCRQIVFFLFNKSFDDHLLNTVIYGDPGTGKTTLALVIAKIWHGFFGKAKIQSMSPVKGEESYIARRGDFVAEFAGQTSIKTRKLLTRMKGKILIIDEAYQLYSGDKDCYGIEAINELNQYMSENPDLVVIFCGYKKMLEESLFLIQPGLERRCHWFYDIKGYTPKGLSEIILRQGKTYNWSFSFDPQEFFEKHHRYFHNWGGDTKRFLFNIKMFHCNAYVNKTDIFARNISYDTLLQAFEEFRKKEDKKEDYYQFYV